MIPTFVGVTIVIWLVMTLAPGEPDAATSGGGALDHGPPENLQDLESQGRSVRMFRRQFSLDRPRFWNAWPSLETAEVRAALETKHVGVVGGRAPEDVKAATRSLDDWGAYAIPAFVDLLDQTWDEPELQTLTLRYLRQAAYTFRAVRPRRLPADGGGPGGGSPGRHGERAHQQRRLHLEARRGPRRAQRRSSPTGRRGSRSARTRWDYSGWDEGQARPRRHAVRQVLEQPAPRRPRPLQPHQGARGRHDPGPAQVLALPRRAVVPRRLDPGRLPRRLRRHAPRQGVGSGHRRRAVHALQHPDLRDGHDPPALAGRVVGVVPDRGLRELERAGNHDDLGALPRRAQAHHAADARLHVRRPGLHLAPGPLRACCRC